MHIGTAFGTSAHSTKILILFFCFMHISLNVFTSKMLSIQCFSNFLIKPSDKKYFMYEKKLHGKNIMKSCNTSKQSLILYRMCAVPEMTETTIVVQF